MLIGLILGAGLLLLITFGWLTSAPAYKGPESDHFNGTHFLNGEGYNEQGFLDLVRWVTTRKPGEWTELPDDEAEYGPRPALRISDSTQVITYINHSTFLLQTNGLNILTDPVYSERVSPLSFAGPKRMRPPGIRFRDLPEIDIVLISHNHYDHLDIKTLIRIRDKHDPVFITPLGVDLYLHKKGIHRTVSLDWWEDHEVGNDLTVSAVRAQHFSSRGMFDRDRTLWAGYVIQSSHGNIYFAGDTGYNNFFTRIGEQYGPIKTALIPIGAYIPEWFMSPVHVDPEQALQIHRDINAELSIGMHYGTFPLADDGQMDPINDLNAALDGEPFILMKEGESLVRN